MSRFILAGWITLRQSRRPRPWALATSTRMRRRPRSRPDPCGWSPQTVPAAGNARIVHPNANAAKLSAPLSAPTNYFDLTFDAEQGRAYRLWIRGKAENNNWANDSVFVQFSGSVTAAGSPIYRIGTTSATEVNLEDCSGCGLSGWGWQDNGWGVGVLGPVIYFETTGPQTIRVQTREDGVSIDQILVSPEKSLNTAPGTLKSDTTIYPEKR